MNRRFDIILSIILVLTILYELWFSIQFIVDTGHFFPDQVTITYVAWKQSYDVFLAVPNFFLIPLIIILVKKTIQRYK